MLFNAVARAAAEALPALAPKPSSWGIAPKPDPKIIVPEPGPTISRDEVRAMRKKIKMQRKKLERERDAERKMERVTSDVEDRYGRSMVTAPWDRTPLGPAPLSKLLWACVALIQHPSQKKPQEFRDGFRERKGDRIFSPTLHNDVRMLFERCAPYLAGQGGTHGFHAKEAVRAAAALAEVGIISPPPGAYTALSRVVMCKRLELT